MKDLIKKIWMPAAGSGTSVSIAVQSNAQITNPDIESIMDATQQALHVVNDHTFFWYFLIGIAGAMGGMVFKIFWTVLCNKFSWFRKLVTLKK